MIILNRFVADRRRAFVWWSLGVLALVGITVAFYPSIKNTPEFEEIFGELPASVETLLGIQGAVPLNSPAGYTHSQLFANILPILMIVYSVGLGTRAIAGDEESGVLELMVANPVDRQRVLLERAGAVAGLVVALGILAAVGTIALGTPVGMLEGIGVGGLLAMFGAVTLIALLHGALAFAVGAATGRRGLAIAVAAGVAGGGFVLNGLAALEAARPLRFLTPWHPYLGRNMLAQGIAPDALLVPLAGILLLGAAAYVAFPRRDLR